MKRLYIIKVGTTFPATLKRYGDFDKWTFEALGSVEFEASIIDIQRGSNLPAAEECAGVVITGSHSMVTTDLPWSVRIEKWIPTLLKTDVPLFGICYGHQLLARGSGGQVGFHKNGIEVGTVGIQLLDSCSDDPLFQSLPQNLMAHTTHSQTVLRLPPGAIRLASNDHEPNHAFRVGNMAWGVQFHPEYNTDIMRSYINEQAKELESAGLNIKMLLENVSATPTAAKTLRNFARLVDGRLNNY